MSLYQTIGKFGTRFVSKAKLFKFGFNVAPMYRRSSARVVFVSDDLMCVKIKLPLNYRNMNYVGSIFGGSLFASVDPIPMVQLINILDSEYVVWDKSAEIRFKAPARETLYAEFAYTQTEIDEIKRQVAENDETEIVKSTVLTNEDGSKIFCQVDKTIYIASKAHYKQKQALRAAKKQQQA